MSCILVYLCFVSDANIMALALNGRAWTARTLHADLQANGYSVSLRTVLRALNDAFESQLVTDLASVENSSGRPLNPLIINGLTEWVSAKRRPLEIIQTVNIGGIRVVVVVNSKKRLLWQAAIVNGSDLESTISQLVEMHNSKLSLLPHGSIRGAVSRVHLPDTVTDLSSLLPPEPFLSKTQTTTHADSEHSYLDDLERESINIIREAVAVSQNPAMLFSMGKDSMVMLTLARKAFAPGPIPFPLVVIDTRWKFQDMYRFREHLQADPDLSVIVYVNPEAIERDINPFDFGSATHTDITKTQALRKVLDEHSFDFVFGGARRDEEKSRAKERIFSVRSASHGWDPKTQRPELWNLYNTVLVAGQTMRVFPISNWTELDIWRYLERENVDLVPLYYSALRPFVKRNNSLIMIDDERFPLDDGEPIFFDHIRFRTLGCYPLTGGATSHASTIGHIIRELEGSTVSERSSRVIDFDQGASMEQKKKDGYF
jgi:sulfate adenylyltransferase subunit 2